MRFLLMITACLCFGFAAEAQHQKAANTTRGFLVTEKGDTLFGTFYEFEKNLSNHQASFASDNKEPIQYSANEVRSISANGIIYESIHYKVNGAFSGANAPGQKLMPLLYASPAVKLYFFSQIGEYLYFFPQKNEYFKYTPFSRDDAANFVVNYTKKLTAIFNTCDFVKEKIQAGAYNLKKENSGGHVQALQDFEDHCGSKNVDVHLQQLAVDQVKKLYR